MSLPIDQTGSAEFDDFSWLQFEVPGLDEYDFSTLAMPSMTPWEEPLPIDEVLSTQTQTAVQSPRLRTPQRSPTSQPPRRASVATAPRRSSSQSKETNLTVTLEAPNGKKRSWNIKFDNAFQAWFNKSPVENVWPSMQAPVSMIQPTYTPQPELSLDQQFLSMSSYPLTTDFDYSVADRDQSMAQVPSFPSTQPVPKLSQPPVSFAGRAGRVPASTRSSPRRAVSMGNQQNASQRVQPAMSRTSQQKSDRGGPSLPADLVPFLNPHHTPSNDGRVPDKRGNKDTTTANDFYYSIGKLEDLFLPTCEKTVSYNGVEFDPDLSFTGEEFLEYLHCASQRPNRQPILRIQIQPAQYNHRYMRAGQSFKCRFRDCPDKRGTILKGQARVCISEFDDEHGYWLNPFHNAGYVHLFCLEKQTNFIELCDDFPGLTVVPETRSLAHEPPAMTNMRVNNPMALNDVERAVVADWMNEIGLRWNSFKLLHPDRTLRPKFELAEEDTLRYRLTKAHMDNRQLRSVQNKRKRDAGERVTAHLNEHVGDVSKQVALQKKMKKQPPPSKRKRSSSGNIVEETETASPEHALKKQRVSTTPSPL